MPEWVIWLVIGIIAVIAIALVVCFVIKFIKMSPADKKELLVQFLIGLVSIAETQIVGSKKGQEKIAWVEQEFNKTAPWFLKIVLKLANVGSLNELISAAVDKAKGVKWDKDKVQEEVSTTEVE